RHLVRPPGALDGLAVDEPRTRPALRRSQHEHWPGRPLGQATAPGHDLNACDLVEGLVERLGEKLVHASGILAVEAAGDEERPPATACEQRTQLVLRDAGEHRRVRDLVA